MNSIQTVYGSQSFAKAQFIDSESRQLRLKDDTVNCETYSTNILLSINSSFLPRSICLKAAGSEMYSCSSYGLVSKLLHERVGTIVLPKIRTLSQQHHTVLESYDDKINHLDQIVRQDGLDGYCTTVNKKSEEALKAHTEEPSWIFWTRKIFCQRLDDDRMPSDTDYVAE